MKSIIRRKILYIVRLCEILHKTLYLIIYIPVIDLLSDIIAIRLLGNTQFQMTIIVQKTSDGRAIRNTSAHIALIRPTQEKRHHTLVQQTIGSGKLTV